MLSKPLTSEKKASFLKFSCILADLIKTNKNLIFADEFKIGTRKNGCYSWGIKDERAGRFGYGSTFELCVIIAFNTEGRVYFLGTKETVKFPTFHFFLDKVIDVEQKHLDEGERVWILTDNASIHKTEEIKSLLLKTNSSLVSIVAYSPWLNPAEKLIRLIKQKLQREK